MEKSKKLVENPEKSNVKLHISGVINRSISECRLIDIHNEIENNSDKYDEPHLGLLKYERCQLVKQIFGE